MLDLAEIRERMKDRKITVVAGSTGLHKVTIYRAMTGAQAPSYETVKTLSDYLLGEGRFSLGQRNDAEGKNERAKRDESGGAQ